VRGPSAPEPIRRLRAAIGIADPSRRGRAYAVCSVTTIRQNETERLRAELRGLSSASPLATLPDVHFARFVIIDGLYSGYPGAQRPPPQLGRDYLMFSADITTPAYRPADLPVAFFQDMVKRIPEDVEAIWKHCEGFADARKAADRVRFLADSQIRVGLYYPAFPNAGVQEIKDALCLRRNLRKFVAAHQDESDKKLLHDAYRATDGRWSTSS
jgi:hypothetical protein